MRNSAVRSAHASNQEIAIFSGDFLPADGALPWRRQEAPGDSPGRVDRTQDIDPFVCSADTSPKSSVQGRQEKRSVFCYLLREKRLHLLCLFSPNLPTLWLLRKGEPMGAKLLPNPLARKTGGQPRSGVPAGVPKTHGISFRQFEKKCVNIKICLHLQGNRV